MGAGRRSPAEVAAAAAAVALSCSLRAATTNFRYCCLRKPRVPGAHADVGAVPALTSEIRPETAD